VPAVGADSPLGAEVALVLVVQPDVVLAGFHPYGQPHEGTLLVQRIEVELDGADAAVAGRRMIVLVRGREVPTVGGALEEEVVDTFHGPYLHLPHHVSEGYRAERAQGDPARVLVGVDVLVARAVAQPHEAPVGEEVHHRGGRAPVVGLLWWRLRRCGEQMIGGLFRGGEGEGDGESRAGVRWNGYVWAFQSKGGGGVFQLQASGLLEPWTRVGCSRPPSTDM